MLNFGAGFGAAPAPANNLSGFGSTSAPAFGSTSAISFGGGGAAAPTNSFMTGGANSFGGGNTSFSTTTGFGTSLLGAGQQQAAGSGFGAFTGMFSGTNWGKPAGGATGFGFSSPAGTTTQPQNAAWGFGGGQGQSTVGATNAGSFAVQQNQWIGGQKLLDLSIAYASKLDSSGRPLPVSTSAPEKAPETTLQATAAPAAPPAWGQMFAAAPAPIAATAPAAPVINTQCEFEVIVYNNSASYAQKPYVRPAHVGYRRWLQADRDNPDPESLTPVLVLGCDGLKKRFANQLTKAEKLREYTDRLKEHLMLLENELDDTSSRYEELKSKQRRYHQRLLHVMRKLVVLQAKGIPLTNVETRYREKVDELACAIKIPYERIQSLEASQAILEPHNDTFVVASSISEEDLRSVCAILQKQRDGLEHLTATIRKDVRDMAIMERVIVGVSQARR